MSPLRRSRKISDGSEIETFLGGLREGEAIYVNGMATPFEVVSRTKCPAGTTDIRFAATDKRYRLTLRPGCHGGIELEDLDGDNDLGVFFLEFAAPDRYIVSDVRAADYLPETR